MDGLGRMFGNIITERLWRTVKFEKIYLGDFQSAYDAYAALKTYFESCNLERLHSTLAYGTLAQVYADN